MLLCGVYCIAQIHLEFIAFPPQSGFDERVFVMLALWSKLTAVTRMEYVDHCFKFAGNCDVHCCFGGTAKICCVIISAAMWGTPFPLFGKTSDGNSCWNPTLDSAFVDAKMARACVQCFEVP